MPKLQKPMKIVFYKNREWETGNGKRGMGNGEWGTGMLSVKPAADLAQLLHRCREEVLLEVARERDSSGISANDTGSPRRRGLDFCDTNLQWSADGVDHLVGEHVLF